MKSILYFVVTIIILTVINNTSKAQVTVGSGVGIPQLNTNNIDTYFNILPGDIIIEDIIIVGDLEITTIVGLTFNQISITGNGGNLTIYDCLGILFRVSDISNLGNVAIDFAQVTISASSIDDFTKIDVKNESLLTIDSETTLTNVGDIRIFAASILFATDVSFNNTQVSGVSGFTILVQSCSLFNNTDYAISIGNNGFYNGFENKFYNNEIAILADNPMGFTHVKEEGSEFYDNTESSISLNSVSEIYILNNDFNEELYGGIIRIRGGLGITSILNNTINGNENTTRGITVFNRLNATLTDNYLEGITSSSSSGRPIAINASLVNGLTIETNNIHNNPNSVGIRVDGCYNSNILTNYASEHTNNIDILLSDGSLVESNVCSYGTDANLYLTNSQNVTFCNNSCYHGNDGIKLSSTNLMLEMNANTMTSCERGLVYMQDVLTNAQIEKGNNFVSNTLGAEYEDISDPDVINAMRYVVRNTSTEYPSHLPTAWFQPTGSSALDCTPINPIPPPTTITDVNRLFLCAGEISPDGKCINDMMIALQMIEDQVDFLADEDFEDFYNEYNGTTLDLLPLLKDIAVDFGELFPESDPVIEIDVNGQLQNIELHSEYLADMESAYSDLEDTYHYSLGNAIVDISALTPNNVYEEDYQFVIIELLEMLRGNNPSTTSEDKIVDLAESCVVDVGPAVYVAKIVAHILGLNYTQAIGCTPVDPRSTTEGSETIGKILLSPNPASHYIELTNFGKGELFTIYDILGNIIISDSTLLSNRIDIHHLSSGIYFLSSKDSNNQIKFIKQ